MFAAALFLTIFVQAPDYDELVTALSSTQSAAESAREELIKGGVDAFPCLLKYLTDETIVALPYFELRVSRDGVRLTEMKLGDCVFFIIRGQIEGANRPRSFSDPFLLTKENLERWLENHKGLTLAQLRFEAISESIQEVTIKMSKNGVNAHIQKMNYLSTRLSKIVLEALEEKAKMNNRK